MPPVTIIHGHSTSCATSPKPGEPAVETAAPLLQPSLTRPCEPRRAPGK